jgi:cation:H+ antiporter
MPEGFIAITSALQGIPAFGLGTLFGSNVADLTLVFALVILSSKNNIKINSKFLKDNKFYSLILAVPIIFGLDGYYSRTEGLVLIMTGLFFYYLIFKKNHKQSLEENKEKTSRYKSLIFLILSVILLLLGSNLTVKYGVAFAQNIHLSPILIAMLIVGLGTTLPELLFSLRAAQKKQADLALGDILGTVISDATILVGVIALIKPFNFSPRIVYSTAIFMFIASLVLFAFMRSGKVLSKKEAWLLFAFYIIFVLTEYLIS